MMPRMGLIIEAKGYTNRNMYCEMMSDVPESFCLVMTIWREKTTSITTKTRNAIR